MADETALAAEPALVSEPIAPHVWASRLKQRCSLDKKSGARL
jgi:hypothetical protein